MRAIFADRKVLSWALYDWANSAFATTVLAGFFPAFFKDYWSAGTEVGTSTFQLGVSHSLASVLMVILAPVLGAIADSGGAKRRFLAFFALLGVVMTACLYAVAQGDWLLAIGVFVLANVGFSAANAFYDSLIAKVISYGEDRDTALARMRGALDEMVVEGIRTNTPLHRDLVRDGAFQAGGVSIHYLESKLED